MFIHFRTWSTDDPPVKAGSRPERTHDGAVQGRWWVREREDEGGTKKKDGRSAGRYGVERRTPGPAPFSARHRRSAVRYACGAALTGKHSGSRDIFGAGRLIGHLQGRGCMQAEMTHERVCTV